MTEADCYWDKETERMVGNRMTKIRSYLRNGLIKRIGMHTFLINPTKGCRESNTVDTFNWKCTCQHWHKTGTDCSHILAIKLYLQQIRDGGREE